MRINRCAPRRRRLWIAAAALSFATLLFFLRRAAVRSLALILGASIAAFLAEPLCRLFEKRLPRPMAALAGLAAIGSAAAIGIWLLFPPMLREAAELARALPESVGAISRWMDGAGAWLEERLPGLSISAAGIPELGPLLSRLAAGTFAVAANIADLAARGSLMLVLSYFMLRDRDRILLRLELLLPQSVRHAAVGLGNSVCREMRLYLRGQLLISLTVGALAGAGLAAIRVRGALALAPVIGLLNMVPYFGPYIGGIPAVLMALGDGWRKGAMAVAVLAAVQQVDGSVISPRILGSVTGLSPGVVLVGVFAGAQAAGIPGMLFATPLMMVFRTLYRFSVQRMEKMTKNI